MINFLRAALRQVVGLFVSDWVQSGVVLAIILFPLDVALRRLILRVEDVPAWRAAFKRKPARAIAAEATVGRLKERVAGVRSARAPKSAPPEPKPEKTIEDLRARRKR